AGIERGRAAQNLDPVEDREMGLRAVDARHRRRQSIDAELVELESAREDGRAAGIVAQNEKARRAPRGILELREVLVFDALARDHADRLRNLAQRNGALAADRGLAGRVALRLFRARRIAHGL